MTKDELKALGIADDVAAKIIDDYGKNYVSKAQFNAKNEELKAAKAEHETMTKELDGLKKANKDNADLSAQIDALKTAAKERDAKYKADMDAFKMTAAIDMALTKAKARNPKAARALLDESALKLKDDGSVSGLDEQIAALQKSDAYMFNGSTPSGIKPGDVNPPAGGDDQGKSMEATIDAAFGFQQ